jgi:hypothetical protein
MMPFLWNLTPSAAAYGERLPLSNLIDLHTLSPDRPNLPAMPPR